jgi:competence protein ComEA
MQESKMNCRIPRFAIHATLALLCAVAARAADMSAPASVAAAGTGKVNINEASVAQLANLPRVGTKLAERIVEYRKTHGPFGQLEALMEVKGVGEKLFSQLKPHLTLSGSTTLSSKVSSKGTRGGPAGKKTASNSVPVGKGR